MRLFSSGLASFLISIMLLVSYPQGMLTTFNLNTRNTLKIVENYIDKNLSYLKEDIVILNFKDGNNTNKVDLINKTINNDIIPKVKEAEEISKEYFGNLSDNELKYPYQIVSKPVITKDDDNIISFYNDYYEFLGGAHGLTTRTSYTIDKNNEILLNLKDLFVPEYNYTDIINKEINDQIKKDPDKYFDKGAEFKGIKENQNFYIKGENLVIYYQLYEIAPYVSGIIEFNIPLSLFSDSFIYYK